MNKQALWIAAGLLAAVAVGLLVAGAEADRAVDVWEWSQTLYGAFPEAPPTSGTVWRVLAGVVGAVATVLAIAAATSELPE